MLYPSNPDSLASEVTLLHSSQIHFSDKIESSQMLDSHLIGYCRIIEALRGENNKNLSSLWRWKSISDLE